jgi:Flp pilus assembly protein TadG
MLRHIRSKLANRAPAAAGRIARGFLRRQDGAAAIEFALAALPFLAFIFAISEMVVVFFAN